MDRPEEMLESIRVSLNGNFHAPSDAAAGPLSAQDGEAADDEFLRSWPVYTLADAYAERPRLAFVVDSLIALPSLSIVYGGPGSLKSMLLADLAVCAASGGRWLAASENARLHGADPEGGVSFPTSATGVLWLDFDNGILRTHERFEALARARGLAPDIPLRYTSMPRPWLDITRASAVGKLLHLVRSLSAQMVVIDNLGLVSGDANENSGEMAQVMGNLRWLCEEAHAAVILVHHQRKGNSAGEGGRRGDALRGHSSIEAALDLALLVERREAEDRVTVIPTKVRGYRAVEAFGAHFSFTHRPDAAELAEARFAAASVWSKDEREVNRLKQFILTEVKTRPGVRQKELVEAVRDAAQAADARRPVGVNRLRAVIQQMTDSGALRAVQVDRTSLAYYLAL